MKSSAHIEVDPMDLVDQWAAELTQDECRELILALDLMIADYDFTESLIKALQESLDKEGDPETL